MAYSDAQIKIVIKNHKNAGQTEIPYYHELLAENARRSGNGLNFEKTLAAVKQAARERRFLSYWEIAKFSECPWNKVRYSMNRHLQDLLEYCQKKHTKLRYEILKQYKSKSNRDRFQIGVFIDEVQITEAEDYSKKNAEQLASQKALQILNELSNAATSED